MTPAASADPLIITGHLSETFVLLTGRAKSASSQRNSASSQAPARNGRYPVGQVKSPEDHHHRGLRPHREYDVQDFLRRGSRRQRSSTKKRTGRDRIPVGARLEAHPHVAYHLGTNLWVFTEHVLGRTPLNQSDKRSLPDLGRLRPFFLDCRGRSHANLTDGG